MRTKYFYWHFSSGLSEKEINKIKEIASKSGYLSGVTRKDDLSENDDDIEYRDSEVSFSEDSRLYDILCPFVFAANESAGWNYDIDWFEKVQIAKYSETPHSAWHNDGGSDIHGSYTDEGGFKGKVRKLSLVSILSDKYIGGDLEFSIQDNDKENVFNEVLKPDLGIGDIIVFPSYVYHRSTQIKKGTKYSATMWCLGFPFK